MTNFNRFLIFAVSVLFVQHLKAQCPSGSIVLNGQDQVDAFAADHPDCTVIEGNLTITGNPTDLTPLANLTQVTGTLYIQGAASLEGLEGITSVSSLIIGEFFSQSFPLFSENLDPLGNISGALDTLLISNTGMSFTSSVTDFPEITSIGHLRISNYQYHTAPAFPALTFVRRLEVIQTGLTAFTVPPNLAEVSFGSDDPEEVVFSGIYVNINDQLTEINSTAPFSDINDLIINNNPLLETISGFDALETIDRQFELQGSAPSVFDSFHNLTHAESARLLYDPIDFDEPLIELFVGVGNGAPQLTLGGDAPGMNNVGLNMTIPFVLSVVWPAQVTTVEGNVSLGISSATSFQGLNHLISVGGNFSISANSLSQLPQMPVLESIGGNLSITGGASFENFEGLNALASIGGNFTINHGVMSGLISFEGLNSLLSIGGNFDFGQPVQLPVPYPIQSLQGLEMLTEVGGDLTFRNLENLNDISALSNLNVIGGTLRLLNLPALTAEGFELSGLGSSEGLIIDQTGLETIPDMPEFLSVGGIELRENPGLLNTAGLESLLFISGDITIQNNTLLSEIDFNPGVSFSGTLTITDNTVLAECGTPVLCNLIELSASTDIADNAAGCQSVEEVDLACTLLTASEEVLGTFTAYQSGPDALMLEADRELGSVSVTLYDIQGRAVLQKSLNLPFGKTAMPLPPRPAGIYLLRIDGKEGTTTRKLPLF